MDWFCRNQINKHMTDLYKNITHLEEIVNYLVNEGVLTEHDQLFIRRSLDSKRDFFKIIKRRGPNAYECLWTALNKFGNVPACFPRLRNVATRTNHPIRDTDKCYRMEDSPCGKVLIVNNVTNSTTSLNDEICLEHLWTQLGFEVSSIRTPTSEKLLKKINKLSKMDKGDALVIIILTYGYQNEPTIFRFMTEDKIAVESSADIHSIFVTDLSGRYIDDIPKLFFYHSYGEDLELVNNDNKTGKTPKKETTCNNLAAVYLHALEPVGVNSDYPSDCSVINVLYSIFCDHACEFDFKDLITLITKQCDEEKMGFVQKDYFLSKTLYFNPRERAIEQTNTRPEKQSSLSKLIKDKGVKITECCRPCGPEEDTTSEATV